MVFDSETHKKIALELIMAANIPGSALEAVLDYKQAVVNGTIATQAATTNPK